MRGSKGLGGLGGCITVYPPGPLLTVQAPTCPTGTGPKLGPAPSSSAGSRNVPYCPSSCSPGWHRPQVQAGASSQDGQFLADADSSQAFRLVTAWLAPVRARPAPVRARPTPVSGPRRGGQNFGSPLAPHPAVCWQPTGSALNCDRAAGNWGSVPQTVPKVPGQGSRKARRGRGRGAWGPPRKSGRGPQAGLI